MRNISLFSQLAFSFYGVYRSWFVQRAKKPSAETIACKTLDLGRLFPNLSQYILVLVRTMGPETHRQQEITRPWYYARVIPATKNLITTESRLFSTKTISWLEREFPLIVRFYLHF